ncbi:MAG: hypothetical protein J7L88_06470 [Thermoplasmata archaeon]|nr:hypothetical protein [Thermoplasmata archaeon]
MVIRMSYYLISVSNKENLNLCVKYSMAGFTNSLAGFWTYQEIDVGDYISFLYGARVHNLYRVMRKEAYRDAENLPPWKPITFRSGRTYSFPFRLYLKQERALNEPMVREEFSYVAENLLLRGGYRKTHFQGDTITFYNVSSMGEVFNGKTEELKIEGETFIPRIFFNKGKNTPPERFHFSELILQSLLKKYIMRGGVLKKILEIFSLKGEVKDFEVLGEKALPEGHVDILIKRKHPNAFSERVVIEVKTGKAGPSDRLQLEGYLRELGNECRGGILIGKNFSKKLFSDSLKKIVLMRYYFEDISLDGEYSFEELLKSIRLEVIR